MDNEYKTNPAQPLKVEGVVNTIYPGVSRLEYFTAAALTGLLADATLDKLESCSK